MESRDVDKGRFGFPYGVLGFWLDGALLLRDVAASELGLLCNYSNLNRDYNYGFKQSQKGQTIILSRSSLQVGAD